MVQNQSRNPFEKQLEIVATKIIETVNEGIIERRIEHKPYVKIFPHYAYQKDTIYNLKPTSSKLFNYIIFNIEPSKDFIELNVSKLNKNIFMSEDTIRKAIIELCDVCIINRRESMKATYWINPAYLFSGDRISKYPNCITKEYIWDKRANNRNDSDNI